MCIHRYVLGRMQNMYMHCQYLGVEQCSMHSTITASKTFQSLEFCTDSDDKNAKKTVYHIAPKIQCLYMCFRTCVDYVCLCAMLGGLFVLFSLCLLVCIFLVFFLLAACLSLFLLFLFACLSFFAFCAVVLVLQLLWGLLACPCVFWLASLSVALSPSSC